VLGYFFIRKQIQPGSEALLETWLGQSSSMDTKIEATGSFDKAELARGTSYAEPSRIDKLLRQHLPLVGKSREFWSKLFAILTPIGFAIVIAIMVLPKLGTGLPALKGGDAAALVGGMGAVLMILATLAAEGFRKSLDVCAEHITEGFVFAFKAMGSVLPIAGFFFAGAGGELAAGVLNVPVGQAPSLLFELINAAQAFLPQNHYLVAFGVLIVGMVTGIDGSGFAGLPLTGSLSGALGPAVGLNVATLCAVGQMGAVWTGGGTLVAWSSLIAVAGFARVPVLEAVRMLLIPVLVGLFVSTLCAVIFWS
jgi:ethanolamine utilization microcompartment shell protein EutL